MTAMDVEQQLRSAEAQVANWITSSDRPALNRLDVTLAADRLLPAIESLLDADWGYLAAITGLDLGPETGEIEVLYHFCQGPAVLTFRVRVPRSAASVPTVCGLIPSASFYERELSEMLGVEVQGTSDPRRLFLPDEWPEDVYPLRKDFVPDEA